MPTHADIQGEFASQLEAERTRRLRRRFVWFCVVGILLIMLSVWGTLMELAGPRGNPDQPVLSQLPKTDFAVTADHPGLVAIDLGSDAAYLVVFAGALMYVLARRRWGMETRSEIVAIFSVVCLLVCLITIVVTPFQDNSTLVTGAAPGAVGDARHGAAYSQQLVTLAGIFFLHMVGALLISLSPREGLRILVPILVVYAVSVVFNSDLLGPQKVALLTLAMLVGAPGFMWSWWRHRSFTDKFIAREVAARYTDVSDELASARRIHEALFPQPVTRGAVRVAFRYEPMRQIGGDFLFMHPVALIDEGPEAPAISMVVLDVTGHGVPAALAVNRLYVELMRIYLTPGDHTPAEVIKALNRFAYETLAPQAMFATAICMQVMHDTEAGRSHVHWCNAGHPPALLRRNDGRVHRLDSGALMLGVLDPESFDATPGYAAISTGDVVLAYTDGAIEADSAKRGRLGIGGVERALTEAMKELKPGVDPASSVAARVLADVAAHRDGPTADDILIVAVSPAPPPAPPPRTRTGKTTIVEPGAMAGTRG